MTTEHDALVLSKANSDYWEFSRAQWSAFRADVAMSLSSSEVEALISPSQPMAAEELMNILLPLCRILNLHSIATQSLSEIKTGFLGKPSYKSPYVIGITGSVAVGKSSFARMLSALLSCWPSAPNVQLVTTDSFLFPLATLKKKDLLHRKGFPESYDKSLLLDFLHSVRTGRQTIQIPIYSHILYDVIPDKMHQIQSPDIIVLEGLNVLQSDKRLGLNVSDFIDFSIYIDAPADAIKKWYLERFIYLKGTAFQSSKSYFNKFKELTDHDAILMASDTWDRINLRNLVENILPTRDGASLIINKSPDHSIDTLLLRVI